MCHYAHVFCKEPVTQEVDVDYKADLLEIRKEYPNEPEQILLTWRQRYRFDTSKFRRKHCYEWMDPDITITRDSPDSDGSFCILHL
jgi:hypothetical protein